MSHDIRTPMNSIIGMTDLALISHDPEEQLDYLTTVRESADHLMDIINNILDLSKIESGALMIEERCFFIHKALQKVQRIFWPEVMKKGLQFYLEIDPLIPEVVCGDETRIMQILSNLINNAKKFTIDGFLKLRVGIKEQRQSSLLLLFTVQDTGIGIPRDKQEVIFEQFRQVDDTTAHYYGGSGLGLNICKELSELMGGRIWVESQLGLGSTFFVELVVGLVDPSTGFSEKLSQHTLKKNVEKCDDEKAGTEAGSAPSW